LLWSGDVPSLMRQQVSCHRRGVVPRVSGSGSRGGRCRYRLVRGDSGFGDDFVDRVPGVAEVAGVVELLGVDDGGATQAAAFGGGHRPGVRSAFQGFHPTTRWLSSPSCYSPCFAQMERTYTLRSTESEVVQTLVEDMSTTRNPFRYKRSRREDPENALYGDLRIMPMWSTFGLVGGYAASFMTA
jgi:hypothetical protein